MRTVHAAMRQGTEMTIYYDIAAAVHRHPGLGRYAASLGAALLREHGDAMSLFYYGGGGDGPPPELAHAPQRTVRAGRKRWRMRVWAGQLVGARYDDLLPGARLYHATEHLLMPLRTIPTVLTVHDLLFRHYPRYHKLQNYVYLNLAVPLFCRRADAVIAVSEHTKQDLVRSYGLAPGKVTVIYEAADPRFCVPSSQAIEAARARYGLPARYLMTLCAIEPRKNHAGFLRAFECLCRDDRDLYWLVGGRTGWLYEGFFAALERSPVRDRVLMPGYIADEDLAAVYAGALAFVFPSFGEGFGLPVLEAMACGTPVVSSDATSLPEVGGDAARYFAPGDVDQMCVQTRQVIDDPALRAEMRRRGLERANRFSWQRAAHETWSLYEITMSANR
ncbi:MAG: glycosyltransferase family 4 protein [Anaerolineae bacterium]|nr:glycosyltransferase family 4 protein [Anaerolineae bacterium]